MTTLYPPSVKLTNPSDLYMLVATWDDETFFSQLLRENWEGDDHQDVFKKLLEKGKIKYAELMMEHWNWLTKPGGSLEDEFKKNKMCGRLLTRINDIANIDNEDKRDSLKAKMLFIWCIQKQMPETAMLFWKRGQDCLAMALIAYRMSKKQKKKLVDKEGYEEMNRQKRIFSQHAIDLLKACYANNRLNTYALLVGQVEDINENPLTPLEIADKANFTAFISLVPVQDLLHKIWIKDIENYNKYKYMSMILSEACPLLAPALFNIRMPPNEGDDETQNSETSQRCDTAPIPKLVREYFGSVTSFMDTPFVKFTYGLISYLGYLVLFSVVMLTDFRSQMSPLEIVLNIWTSILFIEEVKQAIAQKSSYLNLYNFFDMGALIIYIIGFILRMIHHGNPTICPECLYVARIVLALSLLIFFIRSLQFLWIYNDIGPKIYMMRRLVKDLVSFLLILIVFVTAYGVVSNVILYPNQPLNINLLHDIFYDACWSVLQQFNREETSGSKCSKVNASAIPMIEYCTSTTNYHVDYVWCKANRCPANDWIVSVLLGVYAMFTVVMLLNVLIAMFNATFATINENAKGVSKLQRYRLILEYSSRPIIPTPLCVITYPYFVIKFLFSLRKKRIKVPNRSETYNGDAEQQLEEKEDKKQNGKLPSQHKAFERSLCPTVERWERVVVAKYLRQDKDKKNAIKPPSEETDTVVSQRSKSMSRINQ